MSAKESKKFEDINALIERYDAMKKQEKMDLSSDQDLTIAIMNLISIEEHLVFSGAKTGKTHFYDLVAEVREMRKNLLKTVIKEYEGEVWCISKHLLSASMRLMEVGTKAQSMGKTQDAYDYFNKSYDLYSLFWGLQMNVIGPGSVEAVASEVSGEKIPAPEVVRVSGTKAEVSAESVGTAETASAGTSEQLPRPGFMGKLGQLVRKAVDCCIE